MILMTTKYLENLHRDSPLSQYSIAKTLFAPGSPNDSKMPFELLFLDDPISVGEMLRIHDNECRKTSTRDANIISDVHNFFDSNDSRIAKCQPTSEPTKFVSLENP